MYRNRMQSDKLQLQGSMQQQDSSSNYRGAGQPSPHDKKNNYGFQQMGDPMQNDPYGFQQQHGQYQESNPQMVAPNHYQTDPAYSNALIDLTPTNHDIFNQPQQPMNAGYGYSNYPTPTGTPYSSNDVCPPVMYQEPVAYEAAPMHSYVAPAMMAEAGTFHHPGDRLESVKSLYGDNSSYQQYINTAYGKDNLLPSPTSAKLHRTASRKLELNPNIPEGQHSTSKISAFLPAIFTSRNAVSGTNRDIVYPEVGEKKPPRYLFCLKSKRALYICLGSTFIVLLILGIIGYLYFPRNPNLQLLGIKPVRGSDHMSLGEGSAGLSVEAQFLMTVAVTNINRYPMVVTNMEMSAMIVPNATALEGVAFAIDGPVLHVPNGFSKQVGSGKRNITTQFDPHNNVTFPVTFDFKYTTNPVLSQDLILADILQACGFLNPPTTRPITIRTKTVSVVQGFDKLGYNPSFESEFKINCPPGIGNSLGAFNFTSGGINAVVPDRFLPKAAPPPTKIASKIKP
ncbi:hypothetical protein QVD99_005165 [Batrachochytrium dendrobatidis]|nr:hypothetical protein O5D80_007762 [Batrachochytrium dendrobatidis]KAK5668126.1 hypothetical protein QVD99_005165 [Batrachochytrium dendrobatidis]